MAEEGFKRKLTAILSADVEGYSRLMADNLRLALSSTMGSLPEQKSLQMGTFFPWRPPNQTFLAAHSHSSLQKVVVNFYCVEGSEINYVYRLIFKG